MEEGKKTILIVEDEHALRWILADTLRSSGFEVYEARNGLEGLLLALEKRPDLILLDILLPHMDGIQMAKSLRRDPWGATAKIIILTNLGNFETIGDATGAGVQDYLVKNDWSLEDVVKLVSREV